MEGERRRTIHLFDFQKQITYFRHIGLIRGFNLGTNRVGENLNRVGDK